MQPLNAAGVGPRWIGAERQSAFDPMAPSLGVVEALWQTNDSVTIDEPFMFGAKPLTPRFGSEITSRFQLAHCSERAISELLTLSANRGVLVFRDQNLTPSEQAALAHRLGAPLTFPLNPSGLPEELITISAGPMSREAAGEGWHSDVSSEPSPPSLSILNMVRVPESGGDTLFADMTQAFELLSDPLKALLQPLTARHEPRGHYLFLSGAKAFDALPISDHPVVRIHPNTGKKSLYVNDGFVTKINGLTPRESQSLLKLLYDHIAYTVKIQCRVHWRPNTVVFWDNRSVQHHAAFDYHPEIRLGYRATLRGEQPIPANNDL